MPYHGKSIGWIEKLPGTKSDLEGDDQGRVQVFHSVFPQDPSKFNSKFFSPKSLFSGIFASEPSVTCMSIIIEETSLIQSDKWQYFFQSIIIIELNLMKSDLMNFNSNIYNK